MLWVEFLSRFHGAEELGAEEPSGSRPLFSTCPENIKTNAGHDSRDFKSMQPPPATPGRGPVSKAGGKVLRIDWRHSEWKAESV